MMMSDSASGMQYPPNRKGSYRRYKIVTVIQRYFWIVTIVVLLLFFFIFSIFYFGPKGVNPRAPNAQSESYASNQTAYPLPVLLASVFDTFRGMINDTPVLDAFGNKFVIKNLYLRQEKEYTLAQQPGLLFLQELPLRVGGPQREVEDGPLPHPRKLGQGGRHGAAARRVLRRGRRLLRDQRQRRLLPADLAEPPHVRSQASSTTATST